MKPTLREKRIAAIWRGKGQTKPRRCADCLAKLDEFGACPRCDREPGDADEA